jgi:hypothetical protein
LSRPIGTPTNPSVISAKAETHGHRTRHNGSWVPTCVDMTFEGDINGGYDSDSTCVLDEAGAAATAETRRRLGQFSQTNPAHAIRIAVLGTTSGKSSYEVAGASV